MNSRYLPRRRYQAATASSDARTSAGATAIEAT